MQIDARGFGCPKPVMMAEKALSQIDEGTIEVLVDNEASVKNLTRFAAKQGMYVETGKEDTYWTVKIVKGYPFEIEDIGVEIFSCGTCLKYYNLEDELKVGYRGTTNHIVEGIKDFKKVVWV